MNYTIAVITTLATLIPLIACTVLILTKPAGIIFRLFFVILLFGLSVDLLGWFVTVNGSSYPKLLSLFKHLYQYYSPIEAIFFSWVLYKAAESKAYKTASLAALFLFVLAFLLLLHVFFYPEAYEPLYRIILSFLSAAMLLRHIEQHPGSSTNSLFWIITGIFFYSFSTFVITLIGYTEIGNQLWWLHSLVVVTSYIIYTYAFIRRMNELR